MLDVVAQGHGFLRLGGLDPRSGDVYVSASQIRRCELRAGDEVSGPAREPRRGERHRALIKVDRGERRRAPRGAGGRFRGAGPGRAPPADRARDRARRRPGAGGGPAGAARLRPAGAGARGAALGADDPAAGVWSRRSPRHRSPRGSSSCWSTSARRRSPSGGAERRCGGDRRRRRRPRARRPGSPRRARGGAGEAARRVRRGRRPDRRFPDPAGGRLRGSGRGEAGVRGRAGDRGGGRRLAHRDRHGARRDRGLDDALAAVETTENVLLALDPGLAAAGIVPALDVAACAVSGEESLRTEPELAAARQTARGASRPLRGGGRRAAARADRGQPPTPSCSRT